MRPRECVLIYPSGKTVIFPSRTACEKSLGARRLSVTRAISTGGYVRDLKVIDIDDYSPMADYRYRPTTVKQRRVLGRRRNGTSDETRRRLSEFGKRNIVRQRRLGQLKPHGKHVVCYATGETFPTIRAAAAHYGIQEGYLGYCLRKGRKCKDKWFGYASIDK